MFIFSFLICILILLIKKVLTTADAEYISLTEAAKEAIHLKLLLEEMGDKQEAVTLFNDNQAAQKLSKNPIVSAKSKHIDTRMHFIRDCVQKNLIKIEYQQSNEMEADIFTKGLPAPQLLKLRQKIGLFLRMKIK